MRFYAVEIPLEVQPTICLEAERDELGINCGFQDRVIQIYNGLVFMDFEKSFVESHNYGRYERLNDETSKRLNLYIAYDANRAEESGKAHKKVKRLFEEKNADVVAAMSEFADLAQQGRDILVAPNLEPATRNLKLASLINANFDLRDKIFNVAEENRHMVMTARRCGASAKFAGSGGAIVGTYEDAEQFERLKTALKTIGSETFAPTIATSADETAEIVGFGNWRNS